jgi:hypothetical protein
MQSHDNTAKARHIGAESSSARSSTSAKLAAGEGATTLGDHPFSLITCDRVSCVSNEGKLEVGSRSWRSLLAPASPRGALASGARSRGPGFRTTIPGYCHGAGRYERGQPRPRSRQTRARLGRNPPQPGVAKDDSVSKPRSFRLWGFEMPLPRPVRMQVRCEPFSSWSLRTCTQEVARVVLICDHTTSSCSAGGRPR